MNTARSIVRSALNRACRALRPVVVVPTLLLYFVASGYGMAQPPVQPVDASDPPIEAVEVDADLSSPRVAARTFVEAMHAIELGQGDVEAHWHTALACLDWQDAFTEAEARSAAEDLVFALSRLDPDTTQGLPDQRQVQQQYIGRVTVFPRETHQPIWDRLIEMGQPTPGRHSIVIERVQADTWRFSAQTLAGIGELAELLAPLAPARTAEPTQVDAAALTLAFLGETFERTPLWGWAALLAGLFIGLLIGKLVSTALRSYGENLEKRNWYVRGIALQDGASPASLAIFTLGLVIGLQFIHLTEDMAVFSGKIIQFLYLIAVGWFFYNVVNIIEVALTRITKKTRTNLDDMIVPLIRKALRIFVVIVFSFVVAENVFGLNMTGWLAGLGIAGLAISLAAQDSVKNLFGSLTVFFDHPFKVGDLITFAGHTGGVEQIGFRSTRIRLFDGHLVTVPNMKFIDTDVENITARPSIRRLMDITITYDTPPEKIEQAVQIVKDILNDPEIAHEGRFDMVNQPPRVAFDALNNDSLNIKVFYWYQMAGEKDRGFFTYMDHCQDVNMRLFKAFGEAGIDFAFPTQTLYLAGDKDRQLAVQLLKDERQDTA